jgi:uncharacterized iron-regulated membrane protein
MTTSTMIPQDAEPQVAPHRPRLTVRRMLFWLHFAVGSVIGVVVFFLAATGSLMVFETQIISWAERAPAVTQTAQAPQLGVGDLLRRALAFENHAAPSGITLYRDPLRPAEISFGAQQIVLVDPISGVARSASHWRGFFATVRELHRWLALKGVWRERARAVKGAACLALFLQILAGLVLWLPRKFEWAQIRAVALLRPSLRQRTFEWNLHNVVGIWTALPFLVILVCGLILAYPWATRLLYSAAGTPPPPVTAGRAGSQDPASSQAASPEEQARWNSYDPLIERALQTDPNWTSLSFRFAQTKDSTVIFTVQDPGNLPQAQTRITLNPSTGAVTRRETFADNPRGRRWRMYARYLHTGQTLGWTGQLIALLTCLGVMLLTYSGLSLAVRRAWLWK